MNTDMLDTYINNENRTDFRHYGLEHVRKLLDHFGSPNRSIATIHVAGTNGKGSVAHMLNSIFMTAGYITGLYTSPHLLEINERIRIQNCVITDGEFGRYVEEIVEYARRDLSIHPTYFDILTVCAFRHFRDRRVDIGIIETGLGGRLDSTNVIVPLCTIITEISLDHVHILGNTIEEITREKAGIMKEGVPLVTSNTDREILRILVEKAEEKRAPIFSMNKDFSAVNLVEHETGYRFDYLLTADTAASLPGVELEHPLEKQIANSCCAITSSILARSRFPNLSDEVILKGMKAFSAPGRCQVLCRNPFILFDPAHNLAAVREMTQLIMKKYPSRRITVVLTLMKDKDIAGIMSVLEKNRLPAVYYALDEARCYRPEAGAHAGVVKKIIFADEAELCRSLDTIATENSLFFFTGSFRLYRTALNYAEHHAPNCS
jgi:dihydrofolate synthase/folylpolyglutamate synthase